MLKNFDKWYNINVRAWTPHWICSTTTYIERQLSYRFILNKIFIVLTVSNSTFNESSDFLGRWETQQPRKWLTFIASNVQTAHDVNPRPESIFCTNCFDTENTNYRPMYWLAFPIRVYFTLQFRCKLLRNIDHSRQANIIINLVTRLAGCVWQAHFTQRLCFHLAVRC